MRIIGASIASAPIISSRSMSSTACARGRVTSTRLPNSGRTSNHRRCSRKATTRPTTRIAGRRSGRLLRGLRELGQRADPRFLRRQRAVVDDRGGVLGRPAVADERGQDVRELLRSGVADDGAVEAGETRPVDRRRVLAFVFVTAHERQRVATAGIGDRHAGVTGDGDAGGNSGHDLEADALLVQEQRFGAAAIEDERVAPLEPRRPSCLPALFPPAGNRSLPAPAAAVRPRRRQSSPRRAARGAAPSAGRGGRRAQHPPAPGTAARGRSSVRIAGAGADQIDGGDRGHWSVISHQSSVISRVPRGFRLRLARGAPRRRARRGLPPRSCAECALVHRAAAVERHDSGHQIEPVAVDRRRQRADRRLATATQRFDQRGARR